MNVDIPDSMIASIFGKTVKNLTEYDRDAIPALVYGLIWRFRISTAAEMVTEEQAQEDGETK